MSQSERAALLSIPAATVAASGLAWAGSHGGLAVRGLPMFAIAVGLVFVIQWAAFVPAFVFRTERFYDLAGSITYVVVIAATVAWNGRTDPRSLLLLSMVCVWALRLGSFLFGRVLRAGKDDRFREIKHSFLRFLSAWTMQGLWVSFTLAAVLAAVTSGRSVSFGPATWVGLAVWLIGLGIEAAADEQKRQFRADPGNRGRFIQTGLWSWSRHPNYFGEIVLWIGAAIVAAPVLRGLQWVAMISPLFVTLLLTRISGIPILERRANEKWGRQADYEAYKRRTPVLVPRPPKNEKLHSSRP